METFSKCTAVVAYHVTLLLILMYSGTCTPLTAAPWGIQHPYLHADRGSLLGLSGAHQYDNANLAIHLARKFFYAREGIEPTDLLTDLESKAVQDARWPGRCQTVVDPKNTERTWYLDGAHTTESLDCCMQWFVDPKAALKTEIS